MTVPLVVLAGLAIVGGGLNLPFTKGTHLLEHWLEPVLEGNERVIDVATGTKVGLAVVAILAGGHRHRPRLPRCTSSTSSSRSSPQILADGWRYDSTHRRLRRRSGRAGLRGAWPPSTAP